MDAPYLVGGRPQFVEAPVQWHTLTMPKSTQQRVYKINVQFHGMLNIHQM